MKITDLINVTSLKTGGIAFEKKEGNIYRFLKNHFGFGITKLNGKSFFFRRKSNVIFHVTFQDIIDTFESFLNEADLTSLPVEIDREDLLNWNIATNPIKNNGLLYKLLSETLDLGEIPLNVSRGVFQRTAL